MSSITSYFKPKAMAQAPPVPAVAAIAPSPAPELVPALPSSVASTPAPPAAKSSKESVDEQEFVDFFTGVAKHPQFKGKPSTNRKVAVFGQKYYWGEDVSHPMSAIPASFKKWCIEHGYSSSKCNSILVNVYTEASNNIGWHMDSTVKLKRPQVTSISFAMNAKDRGKQLAEMEFRWPSKEDPKKKTIKKEAIKHGTVIKFDAIKHKKKSCEHRVAKTAHPRVNVTMRFLEA
jgi:alkylated DNA repair dioxygenase AlkB